MRHAVALALIILGIVALAYGSVSFTRQEKVVDLGPVEVSRNQRETIPLSPIAGGIFLVSGLVLLVVRPRG